MKIKMSHIQDAKNKDAGKHNGLQGEWAKKITGQTDPDLAIAALYGMDIRAPKWQEFHVLRLEKVYDTTKNRYGKRAS